MVKNDEQLTVLKRREGGFVVGAWKEHHEAEVRRR
jgi:hypothetical protein